MEAQPSRGLWLARVVWRTRLKVVLSVAECPTPDLCPQKNHTKRSVQREIAAIARTSFPAPRQETRRTRRIMFDFAHAHTHAGARQRVAAPIRT